MKISVIIITKDRLTLLKKCLDSLDKQSMRPYEIVIIDTGENYPAIELIKPYNKLNIIYQKYHFSSIPRSRNKGLEHAAGDIIAFMDDDCIARKDWIKNMYISHKNNKDALIVGKSFNADNTNIVCFAYQLGYSEAVEKSLKKMNKRSPKYFTNLTDTRNLSLKKRMIGNVQFDETFKHGEDIEFGFRLSQKGRMALYDSKIVVYHRNRENLSGLMKQHYYYGRGSCAITYKHPKLLDDMGYEMPENLFSIIRTITECRRNWKTRSQRFRKFGKKRFMLLFISLMRDLSFKAGFISCLIKKRGFRIFVYLYHNDLVALKEILRIR
jgi:glycosyltransferase involved in cell wall biosynthesis